MDSIRWEMLRDGVEDYEYFVILRRLLEEKGDALGVEEHARYAGLLEVPEAVSKSMTEFTHRPEPIVDVVDEVDAVDYENLRVAWCPRSVERGCPFFVV